MPEFSVSTIFAFQFGLGVGGGLLMLAWLGVHERPARVGAWLDAGLGVLIGGTIGARLLYVVLELDYFLDYPDDLWRVWYGGLQWHGAIPGGLLGAALVCRLQKLSFAAFADALALALPFGVIGNWWACRRAGCGYGMAVKPDTSGWISGFLPDLSGNMALRLELQILGMWVGVGLLIVAAWLTIHDRLRGVRLWLVLGLLGLTTLLMGLWRGRQADKIGGLYVDQLLDGGLMLISAGIGIRHWRNRVNRRGVIPPEAVQSVH